MTPLSVLTGVVEHATDTRISIRSADGVTSAQLHDVWSPTLASLSPGDEVALHVGDDPILVAHPRALLDVTELAECMGTQVDVPEVAILRRFMPSSLNVKALEGTIANAAFDLLVRAPFLSDDEVLDRAMDTRALSLALAELQAVHSRSIRESVQTVLGAFRTMIAEHTSQTIDLEASIIAPTLGLQGRLDIALRQPDQPGRIDVVELKSGSPPSHGIRPAHAAQVAAYGAMLRTIRPTLHGALSVWYPRATTEPMRAVHDANGAWLRRLIRVRNEVLGMERALAQRDFKVLNRLTPERLAPAGSFLRQDAESFREAIAALTPNEQLLARAWITSIANEQLAVRERVEGSHMVLGDLSMTNTAPMADGVLVTLERGSLGESHGFRLGDHVVLTSTSSDPHADLPGVFKGSIRQITVASIEVHLRTTLDAVQRESPDATWTMVPDTGDLGLRRQYSTVVSIAERTTSARHRAVLCGEAAPSHPASTRSVIDAAATTGDVFLVHGPPGTGKTSVVLHGIVQRLIKNPAERVLLLAFTRRATDEIERAVLRACAPDEVLTLRSGVTDHITPERLRDARCVIGTIAFVQRSMELLRAGFTTVIVDEASQALDTQVLGILTAIPRCILIGDHLQLPPVVTQPEERTEIRHAGLHELGMQRTTTTTFDRLMTVFERRGWQHAIGRLSVQGRMHRDIQEFANQASYDGRLRPLHEWQVSDTPWLTTDDPVLRDIVPHRLCFIPVAPSPDSPREEARIVATLTEAFVRAIERTGEQRSVGVITPFRAQISLIRDLLPPDILDTITIDTVERYQGSERDLILYSPAVTDMDGLRTITSTATAYRNSTDRKLSVAVTRARQQFIMVGRTDILSEAYSYGILLELSSFTETSIGS